MLKTVQLPPSNYLTTHYQTLDGVTWLQRPEKLNKSQMLSKTLKKIGNFIRKFLESEKLSIKNSNEINNHAVTFLADPGKIFFWLLRMDKNQKLTKKLEETFKNCRFSKNARTRDIKMLKTNPLSLDTIHISIIKP